MTEDMAAPKGDEATPAPLPIDTAPRDGTTVRLFVDYSGDDAGGPLVDDSEGWTIGHNSFDDTGVDEWLMAGWCWSHDHYSEGHGKPIGWLPFHSSFPARLPAPDVSGWTELLDGLDAARRGFGKTLTASGKKHMASLRAHIAMLSASPSPPAEVGWNPGEVLSEALIIQGAWQSLLDKDDRTSPEDHPEMCLISRDELAAFMRAAAPPAHSPMVKMLVDQDWLRRRVATDPDCDVEASPSPRVGGDLAIKNGELYSEARARAILLQNVLRKLVNGLREDEEELPFNIDGSWLDEADALLDAPALSPTVSEGVREALEKIASGTLGRLDPAGDGGTYILDGTEYRQCREIAAAALSALKGEGAPADGR